MMWSLFFFCSHISTTILYELNATRGEALWIKSVECAVHEPCHKCKSSRNQHKVISIHTDVWVEYVSSPFFCAAISLWLGDLKTLRGYEDSQTQSEKEHVNDENDETTHNALLSPNVETAAAVGICLWTASVFILFFCYRSTSRLKLISNGAGDEEPVFFIRNGKERITWANPTHSVQLNLGSVWGGGEGRLRGEPVNIDEHRRVFGISCEVKWDGWRVFFTHSLYFFLFVVRLSAVIRLFCCVFFAVQVFGENHIGAMHEWRVAPWMVH